MSTTSSQNRTSASDAEPAQACTVYYDGACPLCQREIALYQGLEGADAIVWHDVSTTGTDADDLATRDAMARFHVRRADGSLVSGARGFFEVMKTIPRLRWLGYALSVPPIPWIAEGAYRLFLPLRPVLKRIVPAPQNRPRNDAASGGV
jgi:predicted DCC family thiol-disulfide oxidoreductase YuxK